MKNRPHYATWGIRKMKILLVMKLTTFFMLVFCLSAWADSYSQKQLVSLDLQKCSVNKLFKEIRKQTGLRFVYNEAYVVKLPGLNVQVKDKCVDAVLEDIFRNTPYRCLFEDEVIFVAPRPEKQSVQGNVPAEQVKTVKIKGRVADKSGEGLPGVSVVVEGTGTGVSTNVNGEYEIVVQPKANLTLVYSFIGMKTQKILYKGQPVVNVILEEDQVKLDDVVVIGYGQRKKGTVTGSVVTVDAKKMEMMPVPSIEQALQGQSAGMSVMSNSGAPGSSAEVSIRGTNSITAGTTPLYVMDGVVVSAGDFAAINNADIESVTVLKDAASTSIYGSRAANGVILLTTKRGKYGQDATVSFRTQHGWSAIAYGKRDIMNTKQRLDYEELVGMNAGDPNWKRADYEGTDINWMEAIYKDKAPTSSYDLSVSGGSEKLAYYLSAGYLAQEGIEPGSDFDRYTFKLNLEGRMKPWLKAGGNLNIGYEKTVNSYSDPLYSPGSSSVFTLPYWDPYLPDGSISSAGGANKTFPGPTNPLEMYAGGKSTSNRAKLVGAFFLEVNPVKDLVIKSMLGADATDIRQEALNFPSYQGLGNGSVGEQFVRRYSLTLTNTANYMFNIGEEHHFNLLAGQEAIAGFTESMTASASGVFSDRMLTLSTAMIPGQPSGGISEYSFLSWFGRMSYDFRSKYFLDLSVRSDGSSRFGKDNRWATFWSAGAMWNVKGESFLENVALISNAQLSVSIGTSGNSSIGPYDHQALAVGGPSYMGNQGWAPNGLGNENLSWEKLRDINVGVKLGFLDRFNVNIEFYSKRTSDMLMSVPVSMTTGYGSWMDNVGVVTNKGVDLQLDATLLQVNDFTWSVNATASYNKNKILELYGGIDRYLMSDYGVQLEVGGSIGDLLSVRYAGVNPGNGDAMWYDLDGKLTNSFNPSYAVLLKGKNQNAPWNGSFSTNFMYKGIALSLFFTWVKDRYMINNTRYFTESNGGFQNLNQSPKMFDAWQNPGDITDVPRYGVVSQMDDRWVEDASFLRLKNVMLSYTFPARLMQKTRVIRNIKVYGQAQNLLTITKYKGLDPESPSNMTLGDYPQMKQFIFGLDITF